MSLETRSREPETPTTYLSERRISTMDGQNC